MSEHNPLLQAYPLPAFSAVRPEHVVPAVEARLAAGRRTVAAVVQVESPTWDDVVAPLEAAEDDLERTWSPVRHLHAVADTPAWREAYNACLPKLSEYRTELGQNAALYRAYSRIAAGSHFAASSRARRKVVEDALREFTLSGVGLDPVAKDRFKVLSAELSELTSRFAEHVLDATEAWTKHVTDPSALAGLPPSALALAARNAEQRGLAGWVLTLDYPLYSAVMSYAEDRALREEVYTAHSTRASDQGPHAGRWDNGPLVEQILAKRHELAGLVGFASYAHYSLARKMAESPEQVRAFLEDLAARSKPVAHAELDDLARYGAEELGLAALEAWDVPFVSERVRKARYALSQEELRPYFPISRVLAGLFEIVHRLFGIHEVEVPGADRWHPDVRFFEVRDEHDHLAGQFYLDAFARTGKRGGAWMDDCVVRRATPAGVQRPVAYLCCNFSPPAGTTPSLLTHDEVVTLFHEFGHGLHHLLTTVDYAPVSGINGVAWDAVELPSQLLESWCWNAESLSLISGHHATGERLPAELATRLLGARNYLAGMQMVRQLEFALFDMRVHAEYDPSRPRSVQDVLDEVRAAVAVVRPPPCNRFAHGFTHVFAGGYAAGYYSYKWAEVLAADAFARFEDEGLFNRECAAAFRRAILERGGTEDAMVLFREFRGRDPDVGALLRRSGMRDATTSAGAGA
jgi:oligopeptidase A